ncbi:hypothetical protein KC950_03400 [Candidatus Saccharibacteria bacterium]|nr:hypothetical protein [Candidatus Saccharibacteria bacterium]
MSETFDGNNGWKVEDGEVIPHSGDAPVDYRQPHINNSEMSLDPEFSIRGAAKAAEEVIAIEDRMNEDAANGKPPEISQSDARKLNEHARENRGGKTLGVNPSKPITELPGKHGRRNWQT